MKTSEASPITNPDAAQADALQEARGAIRLGAGLWLLAYFLHLLSAIAIHLLFSSPEHPFRWTSLPWSMHGPAIFHATSQVIFWLKSWLIERIFIILSVTAALAWALSCALLGSVRRADTDARIARSVTVGGFVMLIFSLAWHIASITWYRFMFWDRGLSAIDTFESLLGLLVAIHLRALLRHASDRLITALLGPLCWAATATTITCAVVWGSRDAISVGAIILIMMIAKAATGLGFVLVMLQLFVSPPQELLTPPPATTAE